MKPSDVASALAALIPTKRPIYLWGPPGVGKSSIVKQAAESLDLQVCDLRAVLLDPVDLRGLPFIDNTNGPRPRKAEWCPPAFLPRDKEEVGDTRGVLFLDELAQAPPLVQAACLQLTLDRKVGDYELPPNWTVIAASNRQEDRAGAHKLISPLLNRFIHLDLEVSHEDWNAWALAAGLAPEVRAFINFRPALLFDFDPSRGARAFPTPRSWSFVSDVVGHTPTHLLHPVIAGCVSEGPAAEFVAFQDLPRPARRGRAARQPRLVQGGERPGGHPLRPVGGDSGAGAEGPGQDPRQHLCHRGAHAHGVFHPHHPRLFGGQQGDP
ncbi:MAG: MoxR family ATPase [Gemmataceae bacterium]|nr:MoxR family ATPase [Gemmataceae bacterium]